MSFVSKSGLTDLEKFREFKSSRLMVFLSHFEGFGYPPVEALYCGVPCVARPLPVLREVNGQYLHYLSQPNNLPTCYRRSKVRKTLGTTCHPHMIELGLNTNIS
jgi:glycosyltransferase involved in cell wall biosynthesis